MSHTETFVLTIMHAKRSAHNYSQEGNTRDSSVPVKMESCTSSGGRHHIEICGNDTPPPPPLLPRVGLSSSYTQQLW